MARFSSRVVRSARSTWRTSDLATRHTTGVSASSRARTCGSFSALQVGPSGGAERDQQRVFEIQFGAGPSEELGVLGHGAGPAALDEADAELVEQAGHGELVDHRVGDPLALGTVAQRGVEDLVRHGGSFLEAADVRVWWRLNTCLPTKRPPADARGLRAQMELPARARR